MLLPEGTYTVYEEIDAVKIYTVHLDGTIHLEELLVDYGSLCDDWEGHNEKEEVTLIKNENNEVVAGYDHLEGREAE